jgi:hypothetical protein
MARPKLYLLDEHWRKIFGKPLVVTDEGSIRAGLWERAKAFLKKAPVFPFAFSVAACR